MDIKVQMYDLRKGSLCKHCDKRLETAGKYADVCLHIASTKTYLCKHCALELFKEMENIPYIQQYNLAL